MGIIVSVENSSRQQRSEHDAKLRRVIDACCHDIRNQLGPDAPSTFDRAVSLSLVDSILIVTWTSDEELAAYKGTFDGALEREYPDGLKVQHLVEEEE